MEVVLKSKPNPKPTAQNLGYKTNDFHIIENIYIYKFYRHFIARWVTLINSLLVMKICGAVKIETKEKLFCFN